jgi:hypothetical protein
LKYLKYILFLFVFTILNLHCGVYGFRGNNPPEGIKTLAVPLFQDVSGFSEAGLKENFTEALKTKIINDNTFIIADKNVADGILNCTITSVKDEALVISGNENVTKRKITILVKVSFENLKKQKKIWEKQYDNWGEYNSSDVSFSARASGISTAQGKICDDILIDITSNW